MDNDKVNHSGKNRVNWKILILIVVVILAGIGMAAVQEYMKSHYLRFTPTERYIPVESEKGKNLTGIAEKALENEGIDTRYLLPENILDYSPNNPILKFSGTKTFYNAKVYTNHDLTDKEASAVFAADLNRYDIATYFTEDKKIKIYDKNVQVESEIWEYGKNYTLNTSNNILEVIDNSSNKVKLRILNFSIIQNEEQTGAIINEINGKFEKAQRGFHIDRQEPAIVIDAPSHTGNLKNTGDLSVEVVFCNSLPCAMRIEDKSIESESNGWVEYKITYKIKYFNAT